jgi:hypothetical protein
MSKSYENDREGNKQKSSTIACHAFRCYLWTELDRILYEALYTNVSIFSYLIKDVMNGNIFFCPARETDFLGIDQDNAMERGWGL